MKDTKGVILLFQIPKELSPKLPPLAQLKKDDSNYGISPEWTKVVVHIFKDGALLNLARVVWVQKSWTLKELHLHFFDAFKNLLHRWYMDMDEKGNSTRSKRAPAYKHPETGELLTWETLRNLSVDQQFAAFFPQLSEENWKDELNKRVWPQDRMPYILKIENTSGYGMDCHFCSNHMCRQSCALPFSTQHTVLDYLHKVGVIDNTSFYCNKGGKSDLIL